MSQGSASANKIRVDFCPNWHNSSCTSEYRRDCRKGSYVRACHKRDAHGWTRAVETLCIAQMANTDNATRWARIKVAPLGGARQAARTLPSLMSRFTRDRTALRHRFKRCASKMVSQAWALNPWAWAARVNTIHPAPEIHEHFMIQQATEHCAQPQAHFHLH